MGARAAIGGSSGEGDVHPLPLDKGAAPAMTPLKSALAILLEYIRLRCPTFSGSGGHCWFHLLHGPTQPLPCPVLSSPQPLTSTLPVVCLCCMASGYSDSGVEHLLLQTHCSQLALTTKARSTLYHFCFASASGKILPLVLAWIGSGPYMSLDMTTNVRQVLLPWFLLQILLLVHGKVGKVSVNDLFMQQTRSHFHACSFWKKCSFHHGDVSMHVLLVDRLLSEVVN